MRSAPFDHAVRGVLAATVLPLLAACASAPVGPPYTFVPQPGQGQYVRPEWLAPVPPPRIPVTDTCRSRLYGGLVGQHEGAVYLGALPGAKRVIRPAAFEGPDNDFLSGEMMRETYVEVQDYLPGQQAFAPFTGLRTERVLLGPEVESRLTIEIDREGYIQEIRCG